MSKLSPARASLTIAALVLSLFIHAQTATIHTSGRHILGVCEDTILLRGVNYAPYDWGYDSSQLNLDQIAMTGANAVRMPWYANSTAPYFTDVLLDSAIAACIRYKMIPIIELHDLTCDANAADVDTLATWYNTAARVAIFTKYQHSLIIDIANELGYVHWAGNPVTAAQAYQNAYDSAIHIMRRAGINVPIMIDAPDCGSSIDVFGGVASGIISSDPLHNVIFSAHAYWYAYANNDSATMLQDITTALSFGYPLQIGEAADYQDSVSGDCHYQLNYHALLNICKNNNVGWLAWSWDNDQCASRQLSADGTYANLTPYGTDIVNNTSYGLRTSATLTSYLKNGACANGIDIVWEAKPYQLYYDNGTAYIRSLSSEPMTLNEYDMVGRLLLQTGLQPGQTLGFTNTNMGIIRITSNGQQYVCRFAEAR